MSGSGALGRRWRSLLGLAVLTALLGLALYPVEARGADGDPRLSAGCRSKVARLYRAVVGGGGGESFSERELNAHLAWILERNPEAREGRGLTVGVDDLRVDLEDGRASLFVTASVARLPVVLEYRAAVRRADQDVEGPPARLRSVRLGRLPLVPPLRAIGLGYLRSLAGGLQRERLILDHLRALEIDGDAVRMTVEATPLPSPPAGPA